MPFPTNFPAALDSFIDSVDYYHADIINAIEKIHVGPPWFNVKGYGAKGDGTTDDTAAIVAAITAAAGKGVVFFPAGTYKVSSTLALNGCDLVGAALGDGLVVKIQPTVQTFSVITAPAQHNRYRIANIEIDFSQANGGSTCTNPLAIGIDLTANIQGMVRFENVFITLAYTGYKATSCFLMTYLVCMFDKCNVGVNLTGTTNTFIGCYFTNCINQATLFNCTTLSLIGCAYQGNANGANASHIAKFTTCHGLVIQTLDVEANVLTGQATLLAMIDISNCSGVTIAGLKTAGNTLACNGAFTVAFLMFEATSIGQMTGSTFGSAWADLATGAGGTAYSIYVNGAASSNNITMTGNQPFNPTASTGAPTVALINVTNQAGQKVTMIGNVNTGTVTDPGTKITTLS